MAKKPISRKRQDSWEDEDEIMAFLDLDLSDPHWPWVRYWALRMLALRGRLMGSHWWLLRENALQELLEMPEDDYTRSSITQRLRRGADLARRYGRPSEQSCPALINVQRLAERIGLGPVEQGIVLLAAFAENYEAMEALFDDLDEWSLDRVAAFFANTLEVDTAAVHRALLPTEVLRSSGLLRDVHETPLALLSSMSMLLMREGLDQDSLFAPLFQKLPPADLDISAFPHLEPHTHYLRRILEGAAQAHATGIHLLLHGAPGTGKTEYARALADSLHWTVVEVRNQDLDHDPIDGEARFQAFALCQQALARQERVLILFDEVEDVFVEPHPWAPRVGRHKGWTNRLLEQSTVPTIWISNSIEGIDPAYRRRFLYEIAFRAPPQDIRAKILAHHLKALPVTGDQITRWARDEAISPGRARQSARATRFYGSEKPEECAQVFEHLMTLDGHPLPVVPELPFDPDLVETDADIDPMIARLQQVRDARLLFHGPSGTGKTAFARFLAEHMNRTLYTRTAADILGKYVGETEQNIAAAFREAAGEVLLLDEADSFLQKREESLQSWEVTAVNELLQRMEGFTGMLLMTTNFRDSLDPAVFRRFDLEVGFDFLGAAKRQHLLTKVGKMLDIDLPFSVAQAYRLDKIVPADLSILVRRHRFRPYTGAKEILQDLARASQERHLRAPRPIGFLASAENNRLSS